MIKKSISVALAASFVFTANIQVAFAKVAADDLLNYSGGYDFSQGAFKGQTYLNLMKSKIKPDLDKVAMQGFKVGNSSVMDAALSNVGDKVKEGALQSVNNSKSEIDTVANALSQQGPISFYDLPAAIQKVPGFSGNVFDLTTFLTLASGGGVALKFWDNNYAYNVDYGTGYSWAGENPKHVTIKKDNSGKPILDTKTKQPIQISIHEKDPQTGRSFGAGPAGRAFDNNSKNADDVSDKNYLIELSQYIRTPDDQGNLTDPSDFFRTILQTITNCDTSNFANMASNPNGETVASDFLAIYTAEEDRHLMAGPVQDPGFVSHAWDVAILEVTLLGSYYANQNEIWVMFTPDGKTTSYTNTVIDQYPDKNNQPVSRPAALYDYWQPSRFVDASGKTSGRSGINIAKDQFRELETKISAWERANNPALVNKVESHFNGVSGGNVYAELTDYVISVKAPTSFGDDANVLTEDFVAFLNQVRQDAATISQAIQNGSI